MKSLGLKKSTGLGFKNKVLLIILQTAQQRMMTQLK